MRAFVIIYRRRIEEPTYALLKRASRKLTRKSIIKIIREFMSDKDIPEDSHFSLIEIRETCPDVLIDYTKIANAINKSIGNNIIAKYI
jgi:hypothetical protein